MDSDAEWKEPSRRRCVSTSRDGQIKGMTTSPTAVGTYCSHSGCSLPGSCEMSAQTKATVRLMVELGKMTEAMTWKRGESIDASTVLDLGALFEGG
jgi:hypothetical protein